MAVSRRTPVTEFNESHYERVVGVTYICHDRLTGYSGRVTRQPEVEPARPPPAGHLNRRCPARHPPQCAAHPGFTTILFLASWPSAAGLSPCHQAQPSPASDGAQRFRRPVHLLRPSLISFCNQLQFWSAASSCHPRRALYSLTESARTPFHVEPAHQKEQSSSRI